MPRSVSKVVVFATIILAIATGPAAAQDSTFDAQSIIGEWQGSWVDPRDPSNTGSYFMTIKKVDSGRVFTRLYIVGRGAFEGDREATLTGNTMVMQTQYNRAEFVFQGRQMRGTTRNLSSGIVIQEITLLKK